MEEETRSRSRNRKTRRRKINFSITLSADITTNILSRLPVDSVLQCRHVCKTWRALIDDPSRRILITFLQCAYQKDNKSFGFQLVDYNDHNAHNNISVLKVSKPITHLPFVLDYRKWGLIRLSSCNGLVFVGSSKPNVNDVFIFNPFTREYVNLLRSHNGDDEGYMVYGFGYHPRSNVYKVVSIYIKGNDDSPGVVSVYTLGSGSGWRNKGETPYKFFSRRPGLLVNGAIHWMTKDCDNNKIIVSFDLADEKFRIVPSPPAAFPASSNYVDQLGVLEGSLCVTRSNKMSRNKTSRKIPKDIWVLIHKELEEEEDFSWYRKFSIPWKGMVSFVEPRAILKSGRILCSGCCRCIVLYDPKTEDEKCLHMDNNWFDIVPFMKSFVSLKALGEDANRFGKKEIDDSYVGVIPIKLAYSLIDGGSYYQFHHNLED